MRIGVLLCLLPLAVAAQSPTPPGDLCSVEGRVVNAVTGEPVKKATVVLRRFTPPSLAYSTVSDSDGRYAMKNIEAGLYRLWVDRSGFLTAEYGARKPAQTGTDLELSRGQNTKDLNFRLTPHGVVSGRIVDEDGDPIVNAQVQLLRLRNTRGKKELLPVGMIWPGISSNDLGEYRIFGLAPGKYYLTADYRSPASGQQAIDRSATPQPEREYLPAYYPGTPDADAALSFDVAAGAETRGIDFRLSRSRTVSIRGHVTNKAVPGHPQISVNLNSGFRGGGVSIVADGAGKFEFRRVVPGSYTLQASVEGGDTFYAARQHIEVHDEDVDNLNLTIVPGVPVEGRVRVEGGRKAGLDNVSFNLVAPEGADSSHAPLKEDQTLHFENVNAGHYNLVSYELPEGFYVKAVRSGETDVLASGLEVGSEAPAPLEIVLSPHAGQITGVVQNSDTQQPASFSQVVLIPQEKERREQWWYYKTTTTDRAGSFTFKSVAPGEYKAYAWDENEDGAYMDPEFMKPFESKGEVVTVKESSQLTEQLTLISTGPPATVSVRN